MGSRGRCEAAAPDGDLPGGLPGARGPVCPAPGTRSARRPAPGLPGARHPVCPAPGTRSARRPGPAIGWPRAGGASPGGVPEERSDCPRPLLCTCLGKVGHAMHGQSTTGRCSARAWGRAGRAMHRQSTAGCVFDARGARLTSHHRQERAVSPRGAELLHDAQGSSGNGTRVVQPRPGTLARTYSPRFVDESLGGRPVFTILPNPDSRRLTGVCRLAQPPASAIPSVPVTRRWIR
jgi:hypothetical protein